MAADDAARMTTGLSGANEVDHYYYYYYYLHALWIATNNSVQSQGQRRTTLPFNDEIHDFEWCV